MAHFAEISPENIVLRVIKTPDEQENCGQEYLAEFLGLGGTWIRTSYNGTIRKNFAGIGYTYDETRDAFLAPRPIGDCILNEVTCRWDIPNSVPPNVRSE